MPRGSKAISAAAGHRTKAEIAARREAEQDMLSGKRAFERESVKADPVAHAEYRRVTALMKAIGKDDALYSAIVNRYCELFAEVRRYQDEIVRRRTLMDELHTRFEDSDPDSEDIVAFAKAYDSMAGKVDKMDGIIMQKRKMMFDIEKENGMTVAAALRAVPKDNAKKEENPLAAILGAGGPTGSSG